MCTCTNLTKTMSIIRVKMRLETFKRPVAIATERCESRERMRQCKDEHISVKSGKREHRFFMSERDQQLAGTYPISGVVYGIFGSEGLQIIAKMPGNSGPAFNRDVTERPIGRVNRMREIRISEAVSSFSVWSSRDLRAFLNPLVLSSHGNHSRNDATN